MATSKKVNLSKNPVEETAAVTAAPVEETAPAMEATPVEAAAPVEATVPAAEEHVDALTAKILAYGGDENTLKALADFGVESVDDLADLKEGDLISFGLKPLKARKLLNSMKKVEIPTETAAPATQMTAAQFFPNPDFSSVLPSVPTEESYLNSLRTGGVLNVGDSSYISAMRVYYASRCGLFGLPKKIVAEMENFAKKCDLPVPQAYYAMRKQITRRDFGDIFEAIDGLDGSYATDVRRKEFMDCFDEFFCPAAFESHVILENWHKALLAVNSDPTTMMTAFVSAMNHSGAAAMATNLPSTDPVKDASDMLKDAINKTFRGTNLPVVSAMAYEATRIINTLNDPALPAMMGAPNKEMMLKQLNVDVTPSYVRMEQNLVRYILSYVKFTEMGIGKEIPYLTALWQLGSQIKWEELVGSDVDGYYGSGVPAIGRKDYL